MTAKKWKHPLDPKTGKLAFSPVLRSTGERLDLEVDYDLFPFSKAEGFHGNVQDLRSGKWYGVYGKECSIPGCNCDAWVEEIESPKQQANAMTQLSSPPTVIQLTQTSVAGPSQWEGRTDDNRPLYIRFRHGTLFARIGKTGQSIDGACNGTTIFQEQFPGVGITTSEMIALVSPALDFRNVRADDCSVSD